MITTLDNNISDEILGGQPIKVSWDQIREVVEDLENIRDGEGCHHVQLPIPPPYPQAVNRVYKLWKESLQSAIDSTESAGLKTIEHLGWKALGLNGITYCDDNDCVRFDWEKFASSETHSTSHIPHPTCCAPLVFC